MQALSAHHHVSVIEAFSTPASKSVETRRDGSFDIVRLSGATQDRQTLRHLIYQSLDRLRPDAVAIPGWSLPHCTIALGWCEKNAVACVLVSDTTHHDSKRSLVKETVKKQIVTLFGSAFVAGRRSTAYLQNLGFPADRIFPGYDAVDNQHFAAGANEARRIPGQTRQRFGLPDCYIFACCRMIPAKNLSGLLRAYKIALARMGGNVPLVIAGDGPLRHDLEREAERLGVSRTVMFAGHVDYGDLPAYYGLARGMILASVSETWGLVVNEALAARIPVAVSERCGCVPDLVEPTPECLTFDPESPDGMAHSLRTLAERDPVPLAASPIGEWGLETFCRGFCLAVNAALANRQNNRPALARLAGKLVVRLRSLRH